MCIGVGIIFGSMNVIDPELLEGLLFSVANGRLKGQAEIIQRFKNRTGEPFLTQDGLCGYGHTWILKEALESAGAADKLKVADAIRKMNLTAGPAALSFPGPIKFDERGRRQDVPMIFAQWQQGVPVSPEDRALAKPFWPSVWGSIQPPLALGVQPSARWVRRRTEGAAGEGRAGAGGSSNHNFGASGIVRRSPPSVIWENPHIILNRPYQNSPSWTEPPPRGPGSPARATQRPLRERLNKGLAHGEME